MDDTVDMKCPFRKIITHRPETRFSSAQDIEDFAECYGETCPYYYEAGNRPRCDKAMFDK